MTPPNSSLSVDALLALIGELQARNLILEQQNALLTVRVADLERRLGLDSSNSSKPPSSDGPGQASRRTRSLRDRGLKKPGGQPGHPGKHLKRSERVDHTIMHRPASGRHRGIFGECQRWPRLSREGTCPPRPGHDCPPGGISKTRDRECQWN